MRTGMFFAAPFLLATSNASAAEFYGEYGGWDVVKGEDSCGATMEFEGPGATTFSLLKFAEGEVGSRITNQNWSAKEGQLYRVAFSLNGKRYSGEAKGSEDYGRAGFAILLSPEFEQDFAQGASLHVFLGDQRIDQLSLDGTAVAMQAVRRCVKEVQAELASAKREQSRFAHIPKDPFSSPSTDSLAPGPPRPMNIGVWAARIQRNYPSSALAEKRGGEVGFKATIDSQGRVVDCEVTESSGYVDLDEAACQGVTLYGRFHPARSDNGEAVEGEWSNQIRYVSP